MTGTGIGLFALVVLLAISAMAFSGAFHKDKKIAMPITLELQQAADALGMPAIPDADVSFLRQAQIINRMAQKIKENSK